MPKQFNPLYEPPRFCDICETFIHPLDKRAIVNGKEVCVSCYEEAEELNRINPPVEVEYNEPKHYHQHAIDTIEFLQKGFPPEVFLHFSLANVVKYAQRAEYKNGLEDLDKMVDYAIRARDWYKRRWTDEETHS